MQSNALLALSHVLQSSNLARVRPQGSTNSMQADIEAYTTEMEVIGAAYEDMQAKNARLLHQLAEKDGQNSQLLTEKIQIQHQAAARVEQQQQAEAARKLAEQQVQALQERIAALESKLQVHASSIYPGPARPTRDCLPRL